MKRTRVAPALLPLSCLACYLTQAANTAWGEDPMRTQQAEPPTLAEVVVTATRYEEEIRSVPANVSVITAEDLANSTAKDVPEMLGQEGEHTQIVEKIISPSVISVLIFYF